MHSKVVFHQISKHLEVGLKISAIASFFNSHLGLCMSDETLLLVAVTSIEDCENLPT